jgi:hypothetical protein
MMVAQEEVLVVQELHVVVPMKAEMLLLHASNSILVLRGKNII